MTQANRLQRLRAGATKLCATSEGDTQSDTNEEAERLYLLEELDRLRLNQLGAHPASRMAELMRAVDDAGDSADSAAAMYAQALSIRNEMLNLVRLLQATLVGFEGRLHVASGKEDPGTPTTSAQMSMEHPPIVGPDATSELPALNPEQRRDLARLEA